MLTPCDNSPVRGTPADYGRLWEYGVGGSGSGAPSGYGDDHHRPSPAASEAPDACAVLNPHQPACTYPNKYLCGVGVVFKLLTALRAALRQVQLHRPSPEPEAPPRFCRAGTIADVMPLREENRVIVHYGLQELTQTRKLGLQALRQVSGRAAKPAGVGEVGFQLAPRLNASGRLGSATHSVALLTAHDAHEAERLAQLLDTVNQQRRTLAGHGNGCA